MPLFEYRCATCHHDFELLVRNHDAPLCPHCGAPDVEKLLSETAVAVGQPSLPLASSSCPPGDVPCGPACCRLP